MGDVETARHYYSVMRSEVIEHIRLRDQALFLYLGASGVIMGIAFGTVVRLEVMLVIPILALGACHILTQHDIHISAICTYLTKELDVFLVGEHGIPQWDKSEALKEMHPSIAKLRYQGHMIIFLLPLVVAIGGNCKLIGFSDPIAGIAWWLGCVAGFLVVRMTMQTKRLRRLPGK